MRHSVIVVVLAVHRGGRAMGINLGTGYHAPVRRYRGVMSDSVRWERFTFRPGDVVISTPSKCGTTWMQTIVGMLLLDRVDLGAPISTLSPWLDMLIRTDEEVFGLLDRQTHRRFIKTHTPLDGVPRLDEVTYVALIRHPLDVALSNADHFQNERAERAIELRTRASGPPDLSGHEMPFDDLAGYVRWFIDNDEAPTGSGPYGLADYCEQIRTYWDAREAPNVHLFHYADLWADRDGEMRSGRRSAGRAHRRGPVAGVRRRRRARVDAFPRRRHRTRGTPRAVARPAGLLPVGRDPRLGVTDVSG